METNADLVQRLINKGILKSKQLIKAFLKIDRKYFVIDSEKLNAHKNYPLPLGFGQTISQPQTLGFMLELLNIQKGEKVLDVGSGSGRSTALIAEMVGRFGEVYGVEVVPELVEFGKNNLARYNFLQANIELAGKKYGLPEHAPYDKILVSATGDSVPEELFKQLKIGGKMVIPIKDELIVITKKIKEEHRVEIFKGFTFVPLIKPR